MSQRASEKYDRTTILFLKDEYITSVKNILLRKEKHVKNVADWKKQKGTDKSVDYLWCIYFFEKRVQKRDAIFVRQLKLMLESNFEHL